MNDFVILCWQDTFCFQLFNVGETLIFYVALGTWSHQSAGLKIRLHLCAFIRYNKVHKVNVEYIFYVGIKGACVIKHINVYITEEMMVRAWTRLHEKCGRCYIDTLWRLHVCPLCFSVSVTFWMHICMCASFLRVILVWLVGRLCWCFDPETLSLCFVTSFSSLYICS